jgi:hypothetical protein
LIQLQEPNRQLWLWLLYDGGEWTASDLAAHLQQDRDDTFWQLYAMAKRGLVDKLPPLEGSRANRFAVTGTCKVPYGIHVAEVQEYLVAPVSDLAEFASSKSEHHAPRIPRLLRIAGSALHD